jgi:RNA polymerase sigma-70 factor (family 1)
MDGFTNYSDQELFALVKGGDVNAFRAFFYRYNTKVYHFAFHIIRKKSEAEEITQDVFLKLWLGRANLDSINNPDTYLFVMVKNRALDQIDKQVARNKLKIDLASESADYSNITEEEIEFRESKKIIEDAVEKLPLYQRLVFRLSKEKGLTRDEIAEQLKISPNTVKNHLGSAVKFIRRYLENKGKFWLVILFC